MLKSISLLVILALTISFSIQHADALENFKKESTLDTITLSWEVIHEKVAANQRYTIDPTSFEIERLKDGKHERFSVIDNDVHYNYNGDTNIKRDINRLDGNPVRYDVVFTYTFTATHLEPATEYTFKIKGEGKPSIITATTQGAITPDVPLCTENDTCAEILETAPSAGVPDVPDRLTANKNGDDVYLTWKAPDDNGSPITDYIIEYSSDNGNTWSTYNDGVSSYPSVLIAGLADGDYLFRVSAENSIGQGDTQVSFYYADITVENVDDGKPNPPTNLQVQLLKTNNADGILSLIWDASRDNGIPITGYTVQYRQLGFTDLDNIGNNAWKGQRDVRLFVEGSLKDFSFITIEGTSARIGLEVPRFIGIDLFDDHDNSITYEIRVIASNVNGDTPSDIVYYSESVESEPEPESPVPEIPGAVSDKGDVTETKVGGDKTVTLELFAFSDTCEQEFIDSNNDGVHDPHFVNTNTGEDYQIPPVHEYGDGKRQTYDSNLYEHYDCTEGNISTSFDVIIYQPSTGEMEIMNIQTATPTDNQIISLLPEPFFIVAIQPDGYKFSGPTYTDENDIEHKGVLNVNRTYQIGITSDELFANNSGDLNVQSVQNPVKNLEEGVITVGIGVIPFVRE